MNKRKKTHWYLGHLPLADHKQVEGAIASEHRSRQIHSARPSGACDETSDLTDGGFGGRAGSPPEYKGFALIELMVIVSILSVAAAILVPRYLNHQSQRKQEECHRNLHSLLKAERQFFEKNSSFTNDLNQLEWKAEGKGFYQYHFLSSPLQQEGFLFECVGNIDKDPTLDQATIDEMGRIRQESDDTQK